MNQWLWDEILAWAITVDEWAVADFDAMDAYLLGGTLFAYPTVFGDTYRRLAVMEALAAGANNEPFPLRRIVAVTRGRYPELKQSRRQVLTMDGGLVVRWSDRSQLVRNSGEFLMCLAQGIGIDHDPPLDVDHIFASALQRGMWENNQNNRRTHHGDRWRVNEPGNMWLLDASTNRALGAQPPKAKFELLRRWREGGQYRVWNDDQWAMTAAELLEFEAVFEGLDDETHHITSAMERFTRLVTGRADRMLTGALAGFRDAELFASGVVGVEPEEATAIGPELQTRIAASLGLRSSGAHTVAEIWSERRKELEWSFKEATRRHTRLTDPGARAPWLWRDADPSKSGFNYFRELEYATTSGRSKFRVGVSSWLADERGAFMWLLVPAGADEAIAVHGRIRVSQLEAAAREDDRGVWLPIDLKPSLSWNDLATDIYKQVYEIRKVLENTETPGSLDPAAVLPGTAADR